LLKTYVKQAELDPKRVSIACLRYTGALRRLQKGASPSHALGTSPSHALGTSPSHALGTSPSHALGTSLDELAEFLQLKDMMRVKRIAKKLREVEARLPWEGLSVVKKESKERKLGSLERRLRRNWKRRKKGRVVGKFSEAGSTEQ
jgi:hypothetical protein